MALAIVLGLAFGHAAMGAVSTGVLLGFGVGAVALARAPRVPVRLGSSLLLVALAVMATARGGAHHERLERGRAAIARSGGIVRVEGRVCEPPADAASEPAAIVAIERAEPSLPRGGRLRLRCPAGTRLEWSDTVRGLAWIDAPEPPRNPGGFDGRRYADANALLGGGRCVWCRVAAATGADAWPRVTVGRWRTALERRLAKRLSGVAREIVWPLVLGDRSDMPPALGAELRVSGLVHLIALSGLHVTWLAQLVRTFAAVFGAGPRRRALAGALCALVYTGIAGPIPSLARAAVSEVLGSCAALASRRLDPLQALGWSAIVLLVACPGWIDDLGFQLSCVATLGLVTAGSATWTGARRLPGPLRGVTGALVSTLGAQVMSLPLVLASFHLLPWVAPVANLLAVPVAGWLLSAAWLGLMADVAIPGLGAWWFRACDALAALLELIVRRAAGIPGAARAAGHDPGVLALATAGAALLAWASARRRPPAAEPAPTPPVSRAALVGVTLCASALVLAAAQRELRPPPGRAWCVVLDVGQGDAIALGFPDGWWLVDAGPRAPRFDAGEQVVLPFLRWAGVRCLAGLAITHDDADHWGGVPALERGMGVARTIVPGALVGVPAPLARFHGTAVRAGRQLHAVPPLVVRWPPADTSTFTTARGISTDNAGALVLECGVGAGRALLTADVDSTVEARLGIDGPIGVLKAGHHGSASSSGAGFLARVRPAIAAVSCGRRNRFGHPAPAALARLRAAGCTIMRTDAAGACWFELSGHGVRRVDWGGGEPCEPWVPPAIAAAAGALAPARP